MTFLVASESLIGRNMYDTNIVHLYIYTVDSVISNNPVSYEKLSSFVM